MRALLLVRHGETGWNAERRLQGQEQVPLSPRGHDQVRDLRPLVASLRAGAPSTRVICSPLLRARESCAGLGLVPDLVDARWQEADLGDWTGRTREELVAVGDGGYAAWRAGRLTPPRAEPLELLRARVAQAVAGLVDGDGAEVDTVVVVTHGGPIRAACDELVGLSAAHLVPVSPGSLTAFDLSGPLPRLQAYNLRPTVAPGQLADDPPD